MAAAVGAPPFGNPTVVGRKVNGGSFRNRHPPTAQLGRWKARASKRPTGAQAANNPLQMTGWSQRLNRVSWEPFCPRAPAEFSYAPPMQLEISEDKEIKKKKNCG